jgi:hypothetical protein
LTSAVITLANSPPAFCGYSLLPAKFDFFRCVHKAVLHTAATSRHSVLIPIISGIVALVSSQPALCEIFRRRIATAT